jgi:hypothetical protein
MDRLCVHDRCYCVGDGREEVPVSRGNVPDGPFLLSFVVRGAVVGLSAVVAGRLVAAMVREIREELAWEYPG